MNNFKIKDLMISVYPGMTKDYVNLHTIAQHTACDGASADCNRTSCGGTTVDCNSTSCGGASVNCNSTSCGGTSVNCNSTSCGGASVNCYLTSCGGTTVEEAHFGANNNSYSAALWSLKQSLAAMQARK